MLNIKKVAVVGTGVIGIGWIIRFLAHNKIVYAFDKNLKQKKILIKENAGSPKEKNNKSNGALSVEDAILKKIRK